MALTTALNTTINGMLSTELKTGLSSQNIANADKAGYTRKSLNTQYITTNTGSVPVSGVVVGSSDPFLVKALVDDISTYFKDLSVSNSLDYYSTQLGNTDGSNTLSSYINDLYANLKFLATSPETTANKAEVVSTAVNLTNSLRDLSGDIQSLRLEAERNIARSVDDINAALDRIDLLNDKISQSPNNDASLAEYEDQRSLELQKIAETLNIQYFYTSENRLQIYTSAGQALLLSDPHKIDYTVTNVVNGSTLYPAGFSTIDLDGVDLTTSLRGGKLAAFVELRDSIYVGEQEKLNEFARVLQTEVNTLLNTGASVPPRNLMEGSLQGLTAATPFTAAGLIRVAVTDNSGTVQAFQDINLAAMANINDVITALNTVAGVTASLNADGELSISVAPATNGVVINPLTSSVTSSTGESFSQYFGLNDMFIGTSAENIQVSSYLVSNADHLSISVLSSSMALAVGDKAVFKGDGSVAESVANALQSAHSFNAAGNFSAQSNNLLAYGQAYMGNAASQADIAQGEADTSYLVFKSSSDLLTSTSGVNVDEETAKMLVYQNQYKAAAQVVATIQQMLDALIAAMR